MGQLSYYQDLVADFFGIPVNNIKVRILAGDKQSNKFKMAELFTYNQSDLDTMKIALADGAHKIVVARATNEFVSDKQKNGLNQTCFKCSECRFCPFSVKPGEPVLITGPRFKKGGTVTQESIGNDIDSSGLY